MRSTPEPESFDDIVTETPLVYQPLAQATPPQRTVVVGGVESATRENASLWAEVSPAPLVAVTCRLLGCAGEAPLNVYVAWNGELEATPPPDQPVPMLCGKVIEAIPDGPEVAVPVTVKPPLAPGWK